MSFTEDYLLKHQNTTRWKSFISKQVNKSDSNTRRSIIPTYKINHFNILKVYTLRMVSLNQ